MTTLVEVVPCLDVKDGRVVKGVKFEHLRDAGDPATLAQYYAEQGADEVAMLDLAATNENRSTRLETVRAVVENCAAPVTVGGGIRSVEDVAALLECGVAKVSIGTAAYKDPTLVPSIASRFGSHVIVVSIDARRQPQTDEKVQFELTTNGGKEGTGVDAIGFLKRVVADGAGAALLNSIDQDGVRDGFDLELIRQGSQAVSVPVIASGGAGKVEHFVEAAKAGARVVLGASVFHFGTVGIGEVKNALVGAGFETK